MTRLTTLSTFLIITTALSPAAIVAQAAPAQAGAPSGHYCNLAFFTPESGARHRVLVEKLAAAVTSSEELENGYLIKFSGQFREAGEWLDGVRGCCPTIEYSVTFSPQSGTATMRITGGPGAKEFIREEFSRILQKKAPSMTWNLALPGRAAGTTPALDDVLASARAAKRPVLIDVFAEWCAACRLLDRNTYTDADVIQQAKRFVTIRIDATNEETAAAYTKRFGVQGLPTIAFVSSRGDALESARVLGFVDAPTLARKLREIQ